MPEGPEIRHFAKKLHKQCSGKTLSKLQILRGPYTSNPKEKYTKFRGQTSSFQPHQVVSVNSKGKWLYFKLEGPQYSAFGVHHGMEGSWCTDSSNKHIILSLEFESKSIHFQDSRRFGTFTLLTEEELQVALNRLGSDVFEVNSEGFCQAFQTKRIQSHLLCNVLLDQRIVSGIGNYMRADIMYTSKLDPKTEIQNLTEDQIKSLFEACHQVAWGSFKARATTCGSYESSIHLGSYDPLVYRKKVCPKGHAVKTFQSKGRTVHWVPEIQETTPSELPHQQADHHRKDKRVKQKSKKVRSST